MKPSGIFKSGFRGGALLLIASFMIVSAVVRLGAEAGPVIVGSAAKDDAHDDKPMDKTSMPASGPVETTALLKALNQREINVTQRERELEDRIQALQVAEQAVQSKIVALEAAEERLRDTLAMADGASERDLAQLTSVYEQMKSKETAAVFEEMAPEFAAGFLARMRPEVAASILEGMDPKAAYTISVVLAGRNFYVPTE
ncbi:MAG: MotE family protein [Paracoccaceae bacterium]